MNIRELNSVWWGKAYPAERRELIKFVLMCKESGEPWERSLRRAYQEIPEILPQPLLRLCKEIGPRIFSTAPLYLEGDGVTILTTTGRIPATVVHAPNKRMVVVHEDESFVRRCVGGPSTLYLPATGGTDFVFTARADSSWRLRGSRSGNRLLFGRSIQP